MENQPHIRFAETPPGSPKSCLKGSRRLTFEEPVAEPSGEVTASPRSPRKSTKVQVSIRSPDDNPTASTSRAAAAAVPVPPLQKPPDIQFTEHFDQSTPPPNCTSNGAYDFVEQQQEQSNDPSDPRNDPQLMDVASKFVNEIIETATQEAANREKSDESSSQKPNLTAIARDILATGRRSVWVQRAQGQVSKWFTNLRAKAQNTIRT